MKSQLSCFFFKEREVLLLVCCRAEAIINHAVIKEMKFLYGGGEWSEGGNPTTTRKTVNPAAFFALSFLFNQRQPLQLEEENKKDIITIRENIITRKKEKEIYEINWISLLRPANNSTNSFNPFFENGWIDWIVDLLLNGRTEGSNWWRMNQLVTRQSKFISQSIKKSQLFFNWFVRLNLWGQLPQLTQSTNQKKFNFFFFGWFAWRCGPPLLFNQLSWRWMKVEEKKNEFLSLY